MQWSFCGSSTSCAGPLLASDNSNLPMLLWSLCLVWGVRQPTLCYLVLESMYVNQSSLFLEFPCSLLSTIHLSFLHHPFQPNNPYPSVSHDHIQLPTAISSKAHQPKTSRGYTPLRALKRIHAISEPSQPIHLPIFLSESKKATFDSACLSHPKTHCLLVPPFVRTKGLNSSLIHSTRCRLIWVYLIHCRS